MREPGSTCIACGGPTQLRFGPRTRGGGVAAEELRCTSPYLGEHGEIWACSGCGLAFQTGDVDTSAYADVEDPEYLRETDRRRDEFRRLLAAVEQHRRPPGRLLEIGSFAGLCLDEARHRGWDAIGVEPSRWAAAHARTAYGIEVVEGTIADAPDGPYDAVVSWDVLEHLEDPLGDLRRARELAADGTVLGLTTVNIAGRAARVLRGRWPWLMRMHLWYFTPASLRLLLRAANWEPLDVRTHPKRLSVGYVLERSERYVGRLGRVARTGAQRMRLADRVVSIDWGDVILALGRATT